MKHDVTDFQINECACLIVFIGPASAWKLSTSISSENLIADMTDDVQNTISDTIFNFRSSEPTTELAFTGLSEA